MALKSDREELAHDISFYMDEAAERGGVATILTAGSGGAWKSIMGDTMNVVTYAANPSGHYVAGVLMNDMVPLDATFGVTAARGQRDEMPIGGKCTLLKRGWVQTNKYIGTPVAGAPAYAGPSGNFTGTNPGGYQVVGQFRGVPDEDGYVTVEVIL